MPRDYKHRAHRRKKRPAVSPWLGVMTGLLIGLFVAFLVYIKMQSREQPPQVLVKETGAGMSPNTLAMLDRAGVTCIDVAGAGGTSWTKVEMHREVDDSSRMIAGTFADWGIPTAFSIIAARKTCRPSTCIIGAGGIITGLDAARAIAAGADGLEHGPDVLGRVRHVGHGRVSLPAGRCRRRRP